MTKSTKIRFAIFQILIEIYKNNKNFDDLFEIKIREFLPKLLLSYSILKKSKKKIKIILGSQRDILTKLNLFNCIYLDKGSATMVTWLLDRLKKNGNN